MRKTITLFRLILNNRQNTIFKVSEKRTHQRLNSSYLYPVKVTFLSVGKTHDREIAALCERYVQRLKIQCNFQWIETQDIKSSNPQELKTKEGQLIRQHTGKSDHIILLDETGKQFTSREFSAFIQKKQLENKKQILFVLGGAFGFSEEIYALAAEKISLSKMTFPHQLVRLIFVEQLYRAYSILNNEPYHH